MSTTAEKIAEYKRRIEVMEAAERGALIRHMAIHNNVAGWCDTKMFLWDWNAFVYEVKPNPREWWVNFYSGERAWVYESEEHAHTSAGSDVLECIHLREVLP